MTDQKASRQEPDKRTRPVGRMWTVAAAVVGVVLVSWFFVAWLALGRHVADAAGESVGSGFALLLVISVIGAIRGGRA
ncbi:MAG TPA: hypothetical protein VFC00_03550 [Micromonosporaceae bacterium]|nr:hypothetical protein [Micromonosporaceae bacterium]